MAPILLISRETIDYNVRSFYVFLCCCIFVVKQLLGLGAGIVVNFYLPERSPRLPFPFLFPSFIYLQFLLLPPLTNSPFAPSSHLEVGS